MLAGEFKTWNRYLHIATVDGALPTELLLERTLSLTYYDRIHDYDGIEWHLDNRDGLLTRPEYIAAGLIVRLKIGYIDGSFPWKAFIINRFQGGLGRWGGTGLAVGEDESTITFFGRNRNAPGHRGSRPWRRRADAPRKKPRKHYPATKDITVQEMLLDQTHRPRLLKKPDSATSWSTSDAVLAIAQRNGFESSYVIVQPTEDQIEYLSLGKNESDGDCLARLASARDFMFKIDELGVLHWHSKHYIGKGRRVADQLHYGKGEDVINISVDCDFRLPVPGAITGVTYDYRNRQMLSADFTRAEAEGKAHMARGFVGGMLTDVGKFKALTRQQTVPIIGGSLPVASQKTIQAFIHRHYRAFVLVVKTVGNPKLLANWLVDVDGVGSPFADGRWLIDEARHDVSETTYETEIRLKPAPKSQQTGKTVIGHAQDKPRDQAEGTPRIGRVFIQRAAPKDLRPR